MTVPQAILLTGSNRGDRKALLAEARRQIGLRAGKVVRASAVYESDPWGFEDDQTFLNQALIIETELEPTALLDQTQAIEKILGRVRGSDRGQAEKKDGEQPQKRVYRSRPIDIDILFYDELILDSERLTIPHPLIREREFVLVPLREIVADRVHPVYGKAIGEL